MGLAPVNVTYGGSDAVASWCCNVAETMERTNSSISNYAPSYATGYSDGTEVDSISYIEPGSEAEEAYPDDSNLHIEVDLTVQVPPDMIQDDHALALVQVVPPDANISDVPETWGIYDIDLTGDPSYEGEELDRSSNDQYDYEEDPMLGPDSPNDYHMGICDEPNEGSYYSEGSYCSNGPTEGSYQSEDPDEGCDSELESPVSYSDGE